MFKVSCIQLCSSDCDQDNLKRTTVLIKKAIKQKTDFIITPEVSSKFSLNKKKITFVCYVNATRSIFERNQIFS